MRLFFFCVAFLCAAAVAICVALTVPHVLDNTKIPLFIHTILSVFNLH